MPGNEHDISLSAELSLIRRKIASAKEGSGSIICVHGEAGLGKSHLLQAIEGLAEKKDSGIIPSYIAASPPVGKFKVGSLQPLEPFTKSIENILSREETKAKTKFALKAGLTVLTGIPIAGDIFYMIKELGRDWRDYKHDKSSENAKKVSKATADFYDTLMAIADKTPLVILLDDMHWADAQSVELLNLFAENLGDTAIVFVISYKKSELRKKGSPLINFLNNNLNGNPGVEEIELKPFARGQITSLCRFLLPNYKQNEEFEGWLYEKSYGVPGVVSEYLKYFQQKNPFSPDGKLDEKFSSTDYLPASVQTAFSELLETLSEEDKNILASCSSEGRLFTANIAAELMNMDILGAIKKLRSIQNKTGIIKSSGARKRYGVKSTVYEFTQAFYHQFFENMLEYEEHVALHGEIASLLKKKFDEAKTDEEKREIAPYLAAHSAEAGDDETSKTALLEAAKGASSFGSREVAETAYGVFQEIESGSYGADAGEEYEESPEAAAFQDIMDSHPTDDIIENNIEDLDSGEAKQDIEEAQDSAGGLTYARARRAAVNAFHQGKFSLAADTAVGYYSKNALELTALEQTVLLSMAVMSYLEMEDFHGAEKYNDIIGELRRLKPGPQAECFALNASAALKIRQGRLESAERRLNEAAEKAVSLPDELKLMTIANIAGLYRAISPEKAENFRRAAITLSRKLKFNELSETI